MRLGLHHPVAEAVSEELLVDDSWHAVDVEAETVPVVVEVHRDGTSPVVEMAAVNGHDEQRSLFSWAEFLAEGPEEKPSRRNGKPKPATISMFEWALSLEQEGKEDLASTVR